MNVLKLGIAVLAASILLMSFAGCDKDDGDTITEIKFIDITGQFIDDTVEGLNYECSMGKTGKTDSNGNYTCAAGDDVTFLIGDKVIGKIAVQRSMITPYSLFPFDLEAAINLARLLQSIDSDNDPSNGIIVIDETLASLIPPKVRFTDTKFTKEIESALSIKLNSYVDAQNRLNLSILSAGGEVPDGTNIPVADAGQDQNVHTGTVVELHGGASFDIDDDQLSYDWAFIQIPSGSNVVISDDSLIEPTFVPDIDGVYTVQLRVYDGSINSAADTVIIIAETGNSAPVADAGLDQTVSLTGTVSLDGSLSYDADFDLLDHNWTFVRKPYGSVTSISNETMVNASFNPDVAGEYTIRLVVNDGTVDGISDEMTIIARTYWRQVSAGYVHTMAIRDDGTLWGWGYNYNGELGDASTITKLKPVQEATKAIDWKSVSAGISYTMAIKNNGTLWAWGSNNSGELGDGTTTNKITPIQIGTGWLVVKAGMNHTLGIKTNGTLWAWGSNSSGKLGSPGDDSLIPRQEYNKRSDWKHIDTGSDSSVGIRTDGTLWTWGSNTWSQLGTGYSSTYQPLQEVTKATDWENASMGRWHTAAIKRNGTLWSWGYNASGQLADGTTTERTVPTQERTGSTDWRSIDASTSHSVAIKDNGTLWSWGSNVAGEIGDGTSQRRYTPTQEATKATDWGDANSVYAHTVAIKSNGILWAWGRNNSGPIGDGTTTNRYSPVEME